MDKKTVFLHIGLPKTGTTTFQTTVMRSPHVMLSHGIRYLETGTKLGVNAEHHLLVQGILGPRGARIDTLASEEILAGIWAAARREIDTAPESKILISSELFSLEIRKLEDIVRLRRELCDYNVVIALVLRDVADFVNSLYLQRVVEGYYEPIEATIEEFSNFLNWSDLTEKWASVFGRENVRVLRYEDLDRSRLAGHMLEHLVDIKLTDGQLTDVSGNFSLGKAAAEFVLALNRSAMPEPAKRRLRSVVVEALARFDTGMKRSEFVDDEMADVLRSRCEWPLLAAKPLRNMATS